MKRLFSALLLTVLCLNLVGGYVYFFFRAIHIKQEMRKLVRSLPDEQLSQFTFTPGAFEGAHVDNHELKVDGKMYDIARIHIDGNLVRVFALHDKAEDKLLGFLDTTLNRLQNDTTQPPGSIMQFTLLQYTPVHFEFQFSSPLVAEVALPNYSINAWSISLPVDSPPPQA